ncbi:MAG: DUF6527 family protein [Alphaproteobacteria bacterium]
MEEGILYISIKYATAAHKCCSGCGLDVVTPITPTDWVLSFNGESVSLNPSIGNWSFPCRSHYYIHNNQVLWAKGWSQERIDAGRASDRANKQRFFEGGQSGAHVQSEQRTFEVGKRKSPWRFLSDWLRPKK